MYWCLSPSLSFSFKHSWFFIVSALVSVMIYNFFCYIFFVLLPGVSHQMKWKSFLKTELICMCLSLFIHTQLYFLFWLFVFVFYKLSPNVLVSINNNQKKKKPRSKKTFKRDFKKGRRFKLENKKHPVKKKPNNKQTTNFGVNIPKNICLSFCVCIELLANARNLCFPYY